MVAAMNTKALTKIAWLLALLPLWGPIVAICLVVIAAVIIVQPVVGIVLGVLIAFAVIGHFEKLARERQNR